MMQYKGYTAKVEFDPEARILHGEVIGIRDVVTFQGTSVQEVEKAFHNSVDDYLAFCRERGELSEKPFSGQFLLRINADLHRLLSIHAQASGKSLNSFVADCLRQEIADLQAQAKSSADRADNRRRGLTQPSRNSSGRRKSSRLATAG